VPASVPLPASFKPYNFKLTLSQGLFLPSEIAVVVKNGVL
jgi:hypothetical protein